MRQYGQGPRIIVGFHGWSGSALSFEPILSFLPSDVTFYAFDLPGSGQSLLPLPWTWRETVRVLESTLDALGLKSVELVGVCGGVSFGLPLAAYRSDLVARLVMIDPFAYVPWFFRVFTWPWLGRTVYYLTFANFVGRAITDWALAARRTEESSLTEGFAVVSHNNNYGQLVAMCDAARIPRTEFTQFRGPVDILYGARTFRSVQVSVRLLQEALPQAELTEVVGAGHMPMHESAANVASVVFRRLKPLTC